MNLTKLSKKAVVSTTATAATVQVSNQAMVARTGLRAGGIAYGTAYLGRGVYSRAY